MTCKLCGAFESEKHASNCPGGILLDMVAYGAHFHPYTQCPTKNVCMEARSCLGDCSIPHAAHTMKAPLILRVRERHHGLHEDSDGGGSR